MHSGGPRKDYAVLVDWVPSEKATCNWNNAPGVRSGGRVKLRRRKERTPKVNRCNIALTCPSIQHWGANRTGKDRARTWINLAAYR